MGSSSTRAELLLVQNRRRNGIVRLDHPGRGDRGGRRRVGGGRPDPGGGRGDRHPGQRVDGPGLRGGGGRRGPRAGRCGPRSTGRWPGTGQLLIDDPDGIVIDARFVPFVGCPRATSRAACRGCASRSVRGWWSGGRRDGRTVTGSTGPRRDRSPCSTRDGRASRISSPRTARRPSCTSTWTRSTPRSRCWRIRRWRASRSSSGAPAAGAWWPRPATRRGRTASARRCPRSRPSGCAPSRLRLRPPRPLRRLQPADPPDLRVATPPWSQGLALDEAFLDVTGGPAAVRDRGRRSARDPPADRRRGRPGRVGRRGHDACSWPSWRPRRPSRRPAWRVSSPGPAWSLVAPGDELAFLHPKPVAASGAWARPPRPRLDRLGRDHDRRAGPCPDGIAGGGRRCRRRPASARAGLGSRRARRSSPTGTSSRSATRRPTPTIA